MTSAPLTLAEIERLEQLEADARLLADSIARSNARALIVRELPRLLSLARAALTSSSERDAVIEACADIAYRFLAEEQYVFTANLLRTKIRALKSTPPKEPGTDDRQLIARLRARKAIGLNGSTLMMLSAPDQDCQDAALRLEQLTDKDAT